MGGPAICVRKLWRENKVNKPVNGKNLSISDNYRPISLASNLSKILEHIILDKYIHIACLVTNFSLAFNLALQRAQVL